MFFEGWDLMEQPFEEFWVEHTSGARVKIVYPCNEECPITDGTCFGMVDDHDHIHASYGWRRIPEPAKPEPVRLTSAIVVDVLKGDFDYKPPTPEPESEFRIVQLSPKAVKAWTEWHKRCQEGLCPNMCLPEEERWERSAYPAPDEKCESLCWGMFPMCKMIGEPKHPCWKYGFPRVHEHVGRVLAAQRHREKKFEPKLIYNPRYRRIEWADTHAVWENPEYMQIDSIDSFAAEHILSHSRELLGLEVVPKEGYVELERVRELEDWLEGPKRTGLCMVHITWISEKLRELFPELSEEAKHGKS